MPQRFGVILNFFSIHKSQTNLLSQFIFKFSFQSQNTNQHGNSYKLKDLLHLKKLYLNKNFHSGTRFSSGSNHIK
jgi:hypothetical protein